MSNYIKLILSTGVAALVVAICCVAYTWQHWWLRVGMAEIQPSSAHSRVIVYKSADGTLLFEVIEDSLLSIYLFDPDSGRIGIPNMNQFFLLPGVAYSKDIPAPAVWSDNRIKIEKDLNISVENEVLQFDHKQRRIIADLKSYR